MKKYIWQFIILCCICTNSLSAQINQIEIVSDKSGHKLVVDGKDFIINGMNWDYFPRGTNYTYSLWNQPDGIVQAALDEEMSLLKNMGVNVIRTYTGITPKWITYIYDTYGIHTMLNHSFGRYGLTIDGEWRPNTEYSDAKVKKLLLSETTALVKEYKDTRGLLLFLLGNENNYGLFWEGAETEDIPMKDRKSTKKAQAMYKLFNKAAVKMKEIDPNHPIAICNGDLLFLDIIAKHCTDVDILGTNMYRGSSFTDAFDRVKNEYGKPLMFTEFGADAFNVQSNSEDQLSQAYYMSENWREIYKNAAGLGQAQNSIGGFTFQFSDGWWKFGQTDNLDVHDNNASWSNGGYQRDFIQGENNMNEEWFGICAKGPNDARGLYQLYPRAAYYALKQIHSFNPLEPGKTSTDVDNYLSTVNLMDAVLKARGDKSALNAKGAAKVSLSRLTANFTTFNTGGSLITTPEDRIPNTTNYPDELGFDHMQSFFVGVQANPSPEFRANVEFNMLGNVAENPINEIFYENRGRPLQVETSNNGPTTLNSVNRFQVYRAEFDWNHKNFNLKGFYRTGHYHWGYEGDFFGLYPEANYGPNIDLYNGNAPLGVEIAGKKALKGFTLAMGPELWWGANPAILLKYQGKKGRLDYAAVFHEDLEQRGNSESSFAIPAPKTRRATVYTKTNVSRLGIELGGIWGGQPLEGRDFQLINADDPTDKTAYVDQIDNNDMWGGKVKLTFSKGKINWYGQAAAMGLVANGGGDLTQTFTGWRLKDSGSGNQYNFLSGFTYLIGDLQIAPNFLWQKPIEGPIPGDITSPGRARNILSDPFVVRGNRETVAGEILFTYDPTPATWMYSWDSDRLEDARFAMSAGFIFRHLPTTQDAAIGILPDGRTFFPFPGAAPATDLWEAHARIVSKLSPELGFIANLYGGDAQARGSDQRTITRFGMDVRSIYKQLKWTVGAKFNDWGPYDYHRDFNLTFPEQYIVDVSTSLNRPSWLNLPSTEIGMQGIFRTLDQYSPRYCPTTAVTPAGTFECDPTAAGFDNGNEWEVRTYVRINIFN